MKNKPTIASILIYLISLISASQNTLEPTETEALVTDRPDATESATTVSPGFIQIETGSSYEGFKDNSTKFESFTFNTTLVRLGLLDNVEFRLGWDFVEGQTSINNNKLDDVSSGFSPLLFGTKIAISEEKGIRPQMALLGHLYLPFTAGNDYKPETTGVEFIFAFAHTLSEKSSLGYNIGANWLDDSAEASYLYSFSYGYSISEKIGAYAEVYGDLPENNTANHYWDAGLTYLISNNLQLDATVGSGITEGQDILLSAGLSFKIPTKRN